MASVRELAAQFKEQWKKYAAEDSNPVGGEFSATSTYSPGAFVGADRVRRPQLRATRLGDIAASALTVAGSTAAPRKKQVYDCANVCVQNKWTGESLHGKKL